MSISTMPTKPAHHGSNVKRLREILRIKQETLADALGMSQQNISLLEQKEKIDKELMAQIAKALNVPVDAIEHYDPDVTFSIIANTFHNNSSDSSTIHSSALNYQPTFNPLDELLKAFDENKRLYERLLQVEREKSALLEKLLDR